MSARTRKKPRAVKGTAPRRQRCTRCRRLRPPGELARVSQKERLCEDCLIDVGEETADEAGLPEEPLTLEVEAAGVAPAPAVETAEEPAEVDEAARIESIRIREAKMAEHQRMVAAGEHPPPQEPIDGDDEEDRLLRRSQYADSVRSRMGILPDVRVPRWPAKYGRVSASSLGTFSRCPEQWRRRYVLGEREATKGAMLTGSALHGACETLWHHKMAQGEDLPVESMIIAFQEHFELEVDEAGGAGWVEWGEDKRGALTGDDWRARGEVVAAAYVQHVAPRVWPTSTERLFVAWIPGVPIPVVGYIDVTTATEKIDQKFGRNVKSSIGPDWMIQAHLYLLADDLPMAYHSLGWPSTRDGSVSYRTPGDTPSLLLEKTAERYLMATQIVRTRIQQIMMFAETLGPDEPWPDALAHPWACHTCDFKPTCPHWHPEVVVL